MPDRLRRSLHFVPGGNERMHAKALGLPVDGLIFDLEDSVPPDRKVGTRAVVRGWLTDDETGGRERWVRMNPLFSGFGLGDLEETIAGRPDGYLVPKPRAATDVREIAEQLDRLEEHHGIPNGTTRLLPIATETPEGLFNIREVAAASPRVAAISWGIEDLGASMGLARTRDGDGRFLDVPRHARLMCVLAAAAAGVEALDTVYTNVDDLDGLLRECEEALAMGFAGKLSLHPAQVDVINAAFTPTKEAADLAREMIAAFKAHAARGVYAFRFKGRMVDAPHLSLARKIVERARLAGHWSDSVGRRVSMPRCPAFGARGSRHSGSLRASFRGKSRT